MRPRTPRAAGRRVRRRLLALALVLVVAGGLLWLLVLGDTLDVRTVDVRGAGPETASAVRAAAGPAPGTSLVWLDPADVAAAVESVPRVATVDVRRSPPGTLVVTVTERTPVAAVPGPPGAPVGLVDATGRVYRTVAAVPSGLPLLRLPPGAALAPGDPVAAAAVAVLDALPPALLARVGEVRAAGPLDVGLLLTDGRVVRWGGADRSDRKAAVLDALLTRPGSTYDVSSPELAVVS